METRPVVTFVGADLLESGILRCLSKVACEYACMTFLGDGTIPSPLSEEEIAAAISKSALIVVSASEYCGREVFACEEAVRQKKPVALVALGYGSWGRAAFAPARSAIKAVFVADCAEQEEAKLLFPGAEITSVGNPAWDRLAIAELSRESVRARLNISERQKCILVAGEKAFAVNYPLAVSVMEAVQLLPDPWSYKVLFGIHPGHAPLDGSKTALQLYRETLHEYDGTTNVEVFCKGDPFGIGASAMVAGADIVIGTNSTLQIQAAFMGIPAIGIFLRGAFRGRELPPPGSGWWPPADSGAVAAVYGLSTMRTAELIRTLLTPEGFAPMREAQRRHFPVQTPGEAYKKMRHELLKLC